MSGVNNKDFSNLTVTDTAKVLSSSCSPVMPAGAKGALITVETAAVRYRDDGETPVAAAGSSTILNVGDVLTFDSWTYPGNNWRSVLRVIQFVRAAGTSGILTIHWYD